MITENEIRDIFGGETYLEPEILSAVLRFTLAFSYAEHKIMDEYAETKLCSAYAEKSSSIALKDIAEEIKHFRSRYTIEEQHSFKLDELCNGDNHSKVQIEKALSSKEFKPDEIIESMFRICLRLRHNLFHGRKWSYMLQDQLDNFIYATNFLIKALRATGN